MRRKHDVAKRRVETFVPPVTVLAGSLGSIRYMSRSVAYSASLLVILALLGCSALYIWQTSRPQGNPGPRTSVAVVGDVEDLVSAVGTLQPRDSVEVGAQVSGQLNQFAMS